MSMLWLNSEKFHTIVIVNLIATSTVTSFSHYFLIYLSFKRRIQISSIHKETNSDNKESVFVGDKTSTTINLLKCSFLLICFRVIMLFYCDEC